MPKRRGVFAHSKTLVFLIIFLLAANLVAVLNPARAVHQQNAPAAGSPPAPQPCQNPEVARDDQLTDNFITDGEGDPPGDEIDEGLANNNPNALKFTATRTGQMGTTVNPAIHKDMTFDVDFSRLQAIFGATNSNYSEGSFQSQLHATTNIIGLPSGKMQSFQGVLQKTAPKVMTDALRENYIKYVWEKPELAESAMKFSDYQNTAGSEKTVHQLVTEFGGAPPQAPSASEDKTQWNATWGKYWEKIPTAYDEFYIGKLEFRAYLGQPTIAKLKSGEPGYCNNFTLLRTVEFPVPRFFRTAQTTGILNQMMLPKVAQNQQNNLIDIKDNVAGATNSVASFAQYCFSVATNNPISKVIKKVVKVSMETTQVTRNALASALSNPLKNALDYAAENLNPAQPAYAINKATNLRTTQSGCGSTGKVTATLSWTRADDPSGGLPLQDQRLIYSLASNFASGVTNTRSLSASQSNITLTDFFAADTDYWWKVESQYFGAWSTNDNVASFHSITCATATPACTLNISTVDPGGQVTVTSQGGLSGSIGMQGAFGTPVYSALGNLPANGTTTITVPTNAQAGLYVVRVGGFAVGCTPNLSVNATAPPGCTLNKSSVVGGEQVVVTSQNGLSGTIGMQGSFGTIVYSNLGNLPANGTTTITVPTNALLGLYVVRVGGFAVGCTPNLAVNASNIPACTLNLSTVGTGGQVIVTSLNGLFGSIGMQGAFGTPVYSALGNLSAGGTATITIPTNAQAGLYVVRVGGFAVGCTPDLEVTALVASCTISPSANLYPGDTFTVQSINGLFGVVGIQGAFGTPVFGNLATLPANGQVTITIPNGAPAGLYVVRVGGFAVACTPDLSIEARVSGIHPWVSAPLEDDSCIKVFGEGKSGNAPYCAIYNTKFDPPPGTDPTNVKQGECPTSTTDQYKLNDQTNVICKFNFDLDSGEINLKLPTDNDSNGTIDASELGPWDECSNPDGGGNITCDITINVWPNFRIPFLSQAWNNTLYADAKESLSTLQQTNTPGVYTFAQPKVATEITQQDPVGTKLQGWVDTCRSDPPSGLGDINSSGCKDLFNWVTTTPSGWPPEYAGLPDPSQYPALEDCVNQNLLTPQLVASCLTDVTQGIVDSMLKLPGQVNSAVQGINTSGGQVLGSNDGQKIRFVGAVECGKHLTRDIMLKPKVLQQYLAEKTNRKVEFNCDLSASTDATNPQTPPSGTPIPSPTPSTPPGNNGDTCGGRYTLDSPIGNFGDPNCNFSQSELYSRLQTLDPTRADYWFYTIIPCESNYNANAYNPSSTSGQALGLYQMGHAAYPAPINWDYQIADPSTEYDRGDVEWRTQTSNAVNYNGQIGNSFAYWGCSF